MSKVVVQLKATGDAPILKQSVVKLDRNHKVSAISLFLKKQLNLDVFLYINNFCPSLDESIGNLNDCFGELVFNYSTKEAWG
jgi:ubiquitin-like protein ATG12